MSFASTRIKGKCLVRLQGRDAKFKDGNYEFKVSSEHSSTDLIVVQSAIV